MTNKEMLISHINLLAEEDVASLLDTVIRMETKCTLAPKPDCPYCGSHAIIRYGHKCGKQRFLCKSCAKTFVLTTHTISNEYVSICTGIQRNGDAIAATINRANPSAMELISIFDDHIADGTLVLCDVLRSYHAFPGIADCTVKDCNNRNAEDACFYNLNTVNGLHSFIK